MVVSVTYRVGAFGFLAHPELSTRERQGLGQLRPAGQIAGLAVGEGQHRGVRRRSRPRHDLRRVGRRHGRQHAGGVAGREGPLPPRDLGERRLLRARRAAAAKAARPCRRSRQPKRRGSNSRQARRARHRCRTRAAGREDSGGAGRAWLQGAFWPVFDGDVLPGDQYELYQAERFNDTPVLIGTNSDEGALFVQGGVTRAAFEQLIRAGYGAHADAILAAYRTRPTPKPSQAARRPVARLDLRVADVGLGACCSRAKGKGAAYVYYFDHRTPQSPNGAGHAAEIPYVFRTLGQGRPAPGVPAAPRPEDAAMSELVSSYFMNFAKTGDPNGAGLPQWPAFSEQRQTVMHFDAKSSARPTPNVPQLTAIDKYFAWRREHAH